MKEEDEELTFFAFDPTTQATEFARPWEFAQLAERFGICQDALEAIVKEAAFYYRLSETMKSAAPDPKVLKTAQKALETLLNVLANEEHLQFFVWNSFDVSSL